MNTRTISGGWFQSPKFALASFAVFFCAFPLRAEWGLDACLSVHTKESQTAAYLQRLENDAEHLVYLRDRLGGREEVWPALQRKGFQIVVPAEGVGGAAQHPQNQLQEDLFRVFESARALARKDVDVWELLNEPDVGFCADLPDRSVAYMKAVYLGIKAGAGELTKPVLSPALALPPGMWLERAARNGLLDYSDALNVHVYGEAGDFSDVVLAHRMFLRRAYQEGWSSRRELPVWVTECGWNRDLLGNQDETAAQKQQEDFFLQVIRRSVSSRIAVFMPFILNWPKEPGYGLLPSPSEPSLAWEKYVHWTRIHHLKTRPLFKTSEHVPPVVLQFLPQPEMCVPHKVSGSYRFVEQNGERLPIRGNVLAYNFSGQTVAGVLKSKGVESTLKIPPHTMRSVPVAFQPPAKGYERTERQWLWESDELTKPSKLLFATETTPREQDFQKTELKIQPVFGFAGFYRYQSFSRHGGDEVTSSQVPWLGLNGLKIQPDENGGWLFWQSSTLKDGLHPPMAVARVKGISADFIRIQSDRFLGQDVSIRVDLVDDRGQRFTVFENFGMNYFQPSNEIWLNVDDFHVYFWGRCAQDPFLNPARVREIQLRFYFSGLNTPVALWMEGFRK